jgi:hypothetical protein
MSLWQTAMLPGQRRTMPGIDQIDCDPSAGCHEEISHRMRFPMKDMTLSFESVQHRDKQ